MKRRHPQQWVTVNVAVDRGIVDLVTALSAFPRLETIESCQGEPGEASWVCFYYGNYWEHPWRDMVVFLFDVLGPGLLKRVGDGIRLSLHVTETGVPRAEMVVRPGAMSGTVEVLQELASVARCVSVTCLAHTDGITEAVGPSGTDAVNLPFTT